LFSVGFRSYWDISNACANFNFCTYISAFITLQTWTWYIWHIGSLCSVQFSSAVLCVNSPNSCMCCIIASLVLVTRYLLND